MKSGRRDEEREKGKEREEGGEVEEREEDKFHVYHTLV